MDDLIKAYLANNEITRVPTGARTMTRTQMRAAIGYEPERITMIQYHAVMIDETGCEFGADVKARDYNEARDKLREMYPESRIDQLESPQDTAERERRMYAQIRAEMDGDVPPGYYDDKW